MSDAIALVSERVDKLLADVDPKAVDEVTFRGRQYDLGLAWVHFPEGYGGLGLPPAAQKDVERRHQWRRGHQAAPAAPGVHG
jgi:hypothetical protein